MKKLILLVALTTTCTFTFAQAGSSFGIKGGLNYNANGDYFESIGETVEDPTRNIGYHIGLFGKIGNSLYFRPELVYTSTKSEYDSGDFDMQKIDVPLLVGVKILGPISVFGGPSLQYILDSEFDGVSIENIENECKSLLEKKLSLPAYDQCLKASHIFNLLDARGVIGVAERTGYITRIRELAKGCGALWLSSQS